MHTIKAAVFEETNQSVFKDRREFFGSLFKQLVRKKGMVTRKEIKKLLGIGQTTSGRLLKNSRKWAAYLGRQRKTHTLSAF